MFGDGEPSTTSYTSKDDVAVLIEKSDGRQPIRQTDDACRIISSKMTVCVKYLEVVRHNISQYGLYSKCWRLCVKTKIIWVKKNKPR